MCKRKIQTQCLIILCRIVIMDIQCKICGKACVDVYRSYCSFDCLHNAMKMIPN